MEITTHRNVIYKIEKAETGNKFYANLAKVSFALFVFFLFFGTSMPFREKTRDLTEIATSNAANQIIYTFLFITSVISLLPKGKELLALIIREKWFTIFLLYALLSVGWSEYSFVSFKRWFQVLSCVSVMLAMLLHSKSSDDLLPYFKVIIAMYILISIVLVFVTSAAREDYGSWKGLAPSKNHLGQAAVIAGIFLAYMIPKAKFKEKIFLSGLFVINLALIVGCQSSTSLFSFMLLGGVSFLMMGDKIFHSIGIGRTFSVMTVLTGIIMILLVIYLAPDFLNFLFQSAGEDMTFTGRTNLWADIIRESKRHLLFGAGFQGFWVLENERLVAIYQTYIWLPIQAHNGYLDVLNELGVVGTSIFAIMVVNYFLNLKKLKRPYFWVWIFVNVLLVNVQESTFIRPLVLTGVIFMLSYITLFTDINKQDEIDDGDTEPVTPINSIK